MKNIRDKFIISIIDNNGIKQFNIHRLAKKILAYVAVFVAILGMVLFFSIKFLAGELKSMQSHKDDTIDKYAVVYNENLVLQQEIEQSQNMLDEINQKIIDLEDVISMKNANVEVKSSRSFNLSSLNIKQKDMILNILPNSKPFSSEVQAESSLLKSGIIFAIPQGTPIFATADGIVDLTRNNDTIGIGKFVKVVHSFGFGSIYGYLSKVSVNRGDIVRKGQVIGYSGRNANVEGVYYDIRFLGSEVNLTNFINWNLDNFEIVMDEDSIVNWDGLLWNFDDITKISNHKILSHNDEILHDKILR